MQQIILYGMDLSPPVRACLLTLNELGVEFQYKIVDLLKKEHLTEEFLKHNPQHTVPVLNDGDVWIWDSHAICSYLVDKYGKDDSLYPRDLAKRALVDQRMYFDASVLFMSLRIVSIPMFREGVTVVPKEKTGMIIEGYEFVEKFLADNLYLTGNTLTIADFCCIATITSLVAVVPIDAAKYPRMSAWINRIAQLPYYHEANTKGADEYINILKTTLTEINF
jgi:glutathione S-transferase